MTSLAFAGEYDLVIENKPINLTGRDRLVPTINGEFARLLPLVAAWFPRARGADQAKGRHETDAHDGAAA